MGEITELKNVTKTEHVTVGYKCDRCGFVHMGDTMPKGWHEFCTEHDEWGRDSVDSIEYYVACSPFCYIKLVKMVINENAGYKSTVIDKFNIDFAENLIEYIEEGNQ